MFELNVVSDDFQYIMEASERFSDVVEKSLRISDIIMQNGTQSYFILLTECGKTDIEKVTDRIVSSFSKTEFADNVSVNYVFKFLEKNAEKG